MPLLFSYGTLQQASVQVGTFGRELRGRPDALVGFRQTMVRATDPRVIELSGKTEHPAVAPSGNLADLIPGMVFEVTDADLAAADAYEAPSNYRRIEVSLKSGARAWLYVQN